ncbi:MAG: alanine--tRNA ligase [Thermacetogeniaceae bacterium]
MSLKSKQRGGFALLTGSELRRKFLEFFRGCDHLVLPSASLVPKDDPSLLLTVAGMVPFKPYFLGKAVPPHTRITTCQKCLRTQDLDSVGRSARHHTFFEMLGNFSFGDYFKEEAIAWAWEYLTKVIGLSPSDLWITVFRDDEEAKRIWHEKIGVSEERIVPMGEETNFWEAGPVGPCGPCSEILVDLGPDRGCGSSNCGVDCDCGRYLEVWNLVFTEFNRDETGSLSKLPRKNIDTGMGLERIASVVQGVPSNFETDLLFPLIEETSAVAGVSYGEDEEKDVAFRVIADHARAVAFLIGDGVLPSNEGRGYVLRRILRRAVRYGRLLGIERAFLTRITGKVIDMYQDPYPELKERRDYIQRVVALEEERFGETLEQGLQILHDYLEEYEKTGVNKLPGKVAFRLYDTFGFPLELTQEILAERGMAVDINEFNAAMAEQRERARAAWLEIAPINSFGGVQAFDGKKTEFHGYISLSTKSQILGIIADESEVEEASEGKRIQVLLDVTPFYPEGGGQVGDSGIIEGPSGKMVVEDTKKAGDVIVQYGYVSRGVLRKGDIVLAQVDERRRQAAARNHTATHLLHAALRLVLGEHVQQTGSYVAPERLRFDFSHFAPLSEEEIEKVESLVNRKILDNLLVRTYETDLESAKAEGAIALFGEKYGDVVRVVEIGDFSKELCGGTHVHRTSEIGFFKIISESGIGTGTRRIEALTGEELLAYWQKQDKLIAELMDLLRVDRENITTRIQQIQEQLREYEKEVERLRGKIMRSQVDSLLNSVVEVNGIKVLAVQVEMPDMESLRSLGDLIRDRLGSGVVLLGSTLQGKAGLVGFITPDLVKSTGLNAGQIVREIARVIEGGGGGKPEMAQAGGKNPSRLREALLKGIELVRQQLEEKR